MQKLKKLVRSVLICTLLFFTGLVVCHVVVQTHAPVLVLPEDAPPADWIVVPATGRRTVVMPKMEGRLRAALTMYRNGLAPKLILTGRETVETNMMRTWLRQQGIPDEDMIDDPGGINFFASMQYLQKAGGRCLFCVEPLHAPRAQYLADKLGVELICVESSNEQPILYQLIREFLAATKAVIQANISSDPIKGGTLS